MTAVALVAGLVLAGCSDSSPDASKPGGKSGVPGGGWGAGKSSEAASEGGRTSVTFTAKEDQSEAVWEQTADLLRRRAKALGMDDVRIEIVGDGIAVSAPGKREARLTALGQKAELGFRPVLAAEAQPSGEQCLPHIAPPSKPLSACGKDDRTQYELGPVEVAGTDVSDADAKLDPNGGGWMVNLTFTSAGGSKFAETTGRLSTQAPPNNQFGIMVDGKVLSAPSVSQAITGGQAQISGSFTRESAEELAAFLRAGALPVRLTPSSVTHVPG
ncbi:hypothetical protein P8605_13365 [Streptomyces sp. T-3]|nr:hypothetical protein [Streptomyces sp. T-3]